MRGNLIMKISNPIAVLTVACGLLAGSQVPANAFIGALVLADKFIKKEAAIALQTPNHAAWCAKKHPGYRAKWNNYRIPNGRVRYCASPYYSPPWMKWRQAR